MLSQIIVSPAPHTSQNLTTRRLMADVIIGLVPAVVAAGILFRLRAPALIGICVGVCLLSEWVCNLLRRKPNSLGDLSAAVTGLILALSLPPAVPLSVAAIGSVFAIVIVKMWWAPSSPSSSPSTSTADWEAMCSIRPWRHAPF